ncbi:WHIM2 domain [Arabidopsis suecica]|uniref:WHIM2 domain n=2 Tax=Arabidopsis suecica TaxID=45249 RepID=A0A8T2D832_ARASU|nr:WHIM2 domain [Arabidopsis suecica]
MPLLKKKSHKLLEPPKNLEPQELVYQVRLTNEIFRDYQLYLKRLNLYRNRVWTCKSTGKTSLSYEEALDSEKQAGKKVQTLPRELVAPALRIIQFSTLSLKDLADKIATELQDCFFPGAELYGERDGELHPCKILRIVTDGDSKPQYEVGFLDKNKEVDDNTMLFGEDLSWKKFPFSRNFLKSFIRDSTCHSIPWVVNDYLAKAHEITRKIPKELQNKYVFQNGELVQQRKQEDKTGRENRKRKRAENGKHVAEETDREVNGSEEEAINYPIEDLLLPPDPDVTQRPSPSRDFSVPMDCVGDLLMVWDFCTSFGRQLHLWRFSLEDFENAVCHKESNLVLIMEVHACLFRFLINERGDSFKALQRRSRKSKITLITWAEYLCDFLESVNTPDLCFDVGTIKRGHYGLLDPNVKLKILRELVNHITETSMFKGEIDELVEQRHALGAARREEALAEARQIREEKERSKTGEEANGVLDNNRLEKKKNRPQVLESSEDSKKNESTAGGSKMENGSVSSKNNEKSEKRLIGNVYLRKHKRQMTDTKIEPKEEEEDEKAEEDEEEKGFSVKKQEVKSASEDEKGTFERRGPEQRRQYYEREMEKIVIRTNPLGKDRDYNRYWWFRSNGRIFVENSDSEEWGYYTAKEELDALMGSLNRKGERELSLHTQLEIFYDRICSTLQKRTKDIAHNIEMEEAVVRRSTRVRAPLHENPASAFLRYVNKWKED